MGTEQLVQCACGNWLRIDADKMTAVMVCGHCGLSLTRTPAPSTPGDDMPEEVGRTAVTETAATEGIQSEADAVLVPSSGPDLSNYATEEAVPVDWLPGDVILGVYEVKPVIENGREKPFHGAGGMGKVYRVHHRGWNAELAVKCAKPEILSRARGVANFVRECETWVNLGVHPHIVNCYYVRILSGIPRIFAEYVEGGSLEDWIHSGRLYHGGTSEALERILDIAIQFAWGLHYAHQQGLVHQDVKPGNVMMTMEGVAKVTDFGLANAKVVVEEPGTAAAERNVLASYGGMTPAYCSPEQAENAARRRAGTTHDQLTKLTQRTDIYSWAVSVLEMFKGRVTWPAGNMADMVLVQYVQEGPPEPHLPPMPERLVALLSQCLAQSADARPALMNEVAEELLNIYAAAVGTPYPRETPNASELLGDMLNNRAVSLHDLGSREKAEQAWQQALEVDPGHLEATYNRGLVAWRAARLTDGQMLAQMREAEKLSSDVVRAAVLEVQLHLERSDCESAVSQMEALPESDRHQPTIQRLLNEAEQRLSESSRCLSVWEGHEGQIASVAFSVDGSRALTGSHDHTLRLWDTTNGKCMRELRGHAGAVSGVCMSPDGKWAVSGSHDHKLQIWNLETGGTTQMLEGHALEVYAVSLSGDGRRAASVGNDRSLRVWNMTGGRHPEPLWGHEEPINAVHLSADGRWAVTGSGSVIGRGNDKTVRLWDLNAHRYVRVIDGHKANVLAVHLNADRGVILSGSEDRTVRVWDMHTGRCLHCLEGHMGAVTSVCLSPDGRRILSASLDRTVRVWDGATGRCLRTFEGHADQVYATCWSADGKWALSGGRDKTVRLWTVGEFDLGRATFELSTVSPKQAAVAASEFPALLEAALLSYKAGDLSGALKRLRQARALPGYARHKDALDAWQRLYRRLPRHTLNGRWLTSIINTRMGGVQSVCASTSGRWVLAGRSDGPIEVWETTSAERLKVLGRHEGGVNTLSLSVDNRWALSGGDDAQLRLWDLGKGECIRTFSGHRDAVRAVSLSPDGDWAASGGVDRTVRIWSVDTGRCMRGLDGHIDEVWCVGWSADGCWVASGSSDSTVRLWDVKAGRCTRVFKGHTGEVFSVTFSPDGQWILSAGGDKTLQLWDVHTGECVRVFEGHTNRVRSACFSSNGAWAFSGGQDGTLRLWEVATGACVRTFEDCPAWALSVSLSADSACAVSGHADHSIGVWFLDWDLENRETADWDEGARAYLRNFLRLQTPYVGSALALPGAAPQAPSVSSNRAARGKPTRGANQPPADLITGVRQFLGKALGLSQPTTGRGPVRREPPENATRPPDHNTPPIMQELSETDVTSALTRHGTPQWTSWDFERLLRAMGYAGYGWIRPEGILQQLEKMKKSL